MGATAFNPGSSVFRRFLTWSAWLGVAVVFMIVVGLGWRLGLPGGRYDRHLRNLFLLILAAYLVVTPISLWISRRRRLAFPGLVDRVAEAGYYSHARPEEILGLKEEACRGGSIYGIATQREYFADGEDLAECGAGKFLETIRPFLNREGVDLPVVSEDYDCDEKGYSIQIGDQKLILWVPHEWDRDDYAPWELTPARIFAFLNRLLEQAGSAERLYGISGGEDLVAVFLTETQFQIIRDSPVMNSDDKPRRLEQSVLGEIQTTGGLG